MTHTSKGWGRGRSKGKHWVPYWQYYHMDDGYRSSSSSSSPKSCSRNRRKASSSTGSTSLARARKVLIDQDPEYRAFLEAKAMANDEEKTWKQAALFAVATCCLCWMSSSIVKANTSFSYLGFFPGMPVWVDRFYLAAHAWLGVHVWYRHELSMLSSFANAVNSIDFHRCFYAMYSLLPAGQQLVQILYL